MSEIQTGAPMLEAAGHIMPCPTNVPWSAQAMPWAAEPGYSGLMEFTARAQLGMDPMQTIFRKKRKSLLEDEVPKKQHITEEKMAANLDGLHISSDYISHKLSSPDSGSTTVTVTVPTDLHFGVNKAGPSTSSASTRNNQNLGISAKDLEDRLKNANRITVCDEIRRLHADNPIIPKALLERYEKPCTALVLWQPPQKLTEMIIPMNQKDDELDEDEEQDNNNSVNNVDLNYSMDIEM